MASAQEAVERVADYLAERISLEEFEDWSASFVSLAYRMGDVEAQKVGPLIRAILNAYEDDNTESALRQELENAVRPFVPHWEKRSGGIFVLKNRSAGQLAPGIRAAASARTQVIRERKPPISEIASAISATLVLAEAQA